MSYTPEITSKMECLMRIIYKAGFSVLLPLLFSFAAFAEESLSGREIHDNNVEVTEAPFEYQVQTVVLIDKAGNEQTRTLRRYVRTDDGKEKTLSVFDSPGGIRGVATLSWEEDGEDSRWLYLPADGSMKRIAGGGKRNYFMGTDISYEDMDSEDADEYEYRRQANETINGKERYVVDVYPMAENIKKDTNYSHQRRYYDTDTFYDVQTDYYDKRGKLLKTKTAKGIHPAEGNPSVYRANEVLVDNFSNTHKTRSTIKSYEFDESKVPPPVFTERYITSGRYMKDSGS